MINLIWDLDGTLIDSYPVFLESLEAVFEHHHLPFDQKAVNQTIKKKSVNALLEQQQVGFELLKHEFTMVSKTKNDKITLMPGAKVVLEWTKQSGVRNFIYTHKGKNAFDLLDQLEISGFFEEVVTSDHGFKRKPDPEGIQYLLQKYHLNRQETYYVGDRSLDIEAAQQALVSSINFIEHPYSIKIDQLTDLIDYFNDKRIKEHNE